MERGYLKYPWGCWSDPDPNLEKVYKVRVAVAVLNQCYKNLGGSLYFLITHKL